MKTILITLCFFFCSSAFSEELSIDLRPDRDSNHCFAFGGNWQNGSCHNRMQYQQRAVINPGILGRLEQSHFCTQRGGTPRITQRGFRCQNPVSSQGLTRFPLPQKELNQYEIYRDVLNACIDNKKITKHTQCNVRQTNSANSWYDYTNDNNDIVGVPAMAVFEAFRIPSYLMSTFGVFESGERERNILKSELSAYAQNFSLNNCQKSCLVKCAASQVLDYKLNHGTKMGSINAMYDSREGVCTEYSKIANDLGSELGVQVTSAFGPGHAFNYFLIDGERYIGEPQDSECQFFHTRRTADRYQRELGVDGSEIDENRPIQLLVSPRALQNRRRNESRANSRSAN